MTKSRALGALCGLLAAACSGGGPTDEPAATSAPSSNAAIEQAEIRFSEIYFHASDPSPITLQDTGPVAEFVELVNTGQATAQLQGWCITGIKYCFEAAVELAAGAFLVVSADEYDGSLSNKQDRLRLIDPTTEVREEVTYSDRWPWPELADGDGYSLQRASFAGDPADVASWIAALPTPSQPNATVGVSPAREVVITEVNYHAVDDNPATTFIELFNATAEPIDLNGWCIEGLEFCWSVATVVTPGGLLTLQGSYDPAQLSAASDRLRLVDSVGTIEDVVAYEDSGLWPALADGYGHSLQRLDPSMSGRPPGNWISADANPGSFVPSSIGAPLPTFDDVTFVLSPDAGVDFELTATVTDAREVSVAYRIGFEDEHTVAADLVDGHVSAVLPGQAAGALIRFRLVGTGDGGIGTWPRQGDGAQYEGTVVRSEPTEASALPRFQLFMPDDVYAAAASDDSLHGDEGYPAVMAFEGEVFDNVLIRIKGNQARTNPKKKWKVRLPAGHEWFAAGRLVSPVDQFDLLSAATDKSYSREILTADMQELSGGYVQQVFPMRVERNGSFFGLYMYGESIDGDWRDRYGFSKDSLVYKGEGFAQLEKQDLVLSQDTLRKKYERHSLSYLDDNDQLLRDLITTLNTLEGDALAAFAYQHIDIPQVVEALATMRVVQHSEWQHKNYFLIYDPADEKWRLIPIDFDLNFGHWFHSPCAARCDDTQVLYWPNYPDHNRLARVLLRDDVLREMVDRRTRTLADEFFAAGLIEARLDELAALMGPDAALDVRVWGQYGARQTMAEAQAILLKNYVVVQRVRYLERGELLPTAQEGVPAIEVGTYDVDDAGQVVHAALTNTNPVAVDVSGRTFDEISAVMPAGVVIPAGGTILVVFERQPVGAQVTPQLVVTAARSG
ncbi:MAG: CotH kinase family protein [Actinobacteria bacterium]|nr:CotH kinase family protein [Actinomycetota bacterium]